jgi:hypothetical protein
MPLGLTPPLTDYDDDDDNYNDGDEAREEGNAVVVRK